MLSGSDGLSNDLRKMDPETQARLETLLEAAGMLIGLFLDLSCIKWIVGTVPTSQNTGLSHSWLVSYI